MRSVLAREIGCGERGGAGRAPAGERYAVHYGERFAGFAGHQQVAAENGCLRDLGIVGKHRDNLAAEEFLVARRPGRHQEKHRFGAGLCNRVVMPHRHRDVGAKALAQRFDQRRIGEDAVDVLGCDDAHDYFTLRMILSENRFPLFGIMRYAAFGCR